MHTDTQITSKRRFLTLLLTLAVALIGLVLAPSAASADPTDDVGIAIVGGSPATEQYGAVALWDPAVGRSRCTAALIAPSWAVTAAHCQSFLVEHVTEIRASSKDNRTGYESAGLAEIHPHPDYDPELGLNDLALLRFERPVARTQPLKLATSPPTVGTVTRIAGWGRLCDDPANPACMTTANILQQLDTRIAPNTTCPFLTDSATQLCVTPASGKEAMACNGDSGGPMKVDVLHQDVLVAITLGDGDDAGPRPHDCSTNPAGGPGAGVWLKITPYLDWIYDTM